MVLHLRGCGVIMVVPAHSVVTEKVGVLHTKVKALRGTTKTASDRVAQAP